MSADGAIAPAPNPVVAELLALESKLEAAWTAVEGGVEQFFVTEIPVLEADVAEAIKMFGEEVLGDVITALTQVTTQGSAVGQVVTALIQTAEKQGIALALNTAQVAAGQLVMTAQNKLAAMKAVATPTH